MDYLLALLQGLGIAAAIGIRPFLPVLLAGALAGADLGLDFEGTEFAFLEQAGFLFAMLVGVFVLGIVERRAAERVGIVLLVVSVVLGAAIEQASPQRRWQVTALRLPWVLPAIGSRGRSRRGVMLRPLSC